MGQGEEFIGPFDAFNEEMPILDNRAKCTVEYNKLEGSSWAPVLINGQKFFFTPGNRYSLAVLDDKGWVVYIQRAYFIGLDHVTSMGKFLSLESGGKPIYASSPHAIVAAKPE
jgi:hypothetical protein